MKSLDPRVNRLPIPTTNWSTPMEKEAMDQFNTYEVFVRPRENKPYQHEGIVHAPNIKMALILAKEQYSRRNTCAGIWVTPTDKVRLSAYTEGETDAYDTLDEISDTSGNVLYEIFHLRKRGKQHIHVGTVTSGGYDAAAWLAKEKLREPKSVFNLWVIAREDFEKLEDLDIWMTLGEKKFRDAIAYKALDKIKKFKAEQSEH